MAEFSELEAEGGDDGGGELDGTLAMYQISEGADRAREEQLSLSFPFRLF